MTPTNSYKDFRKSRRPGIVFALVLAVLLILVLAACSEVRGGPRVVTNLDATARPTSEFRK